MKIDLVTRKLYTDSGVLIKELYCPLKVSYSQLNKDSSGKLNCSECSKSILETANLEDTTLLTIMEKNPAQCVKIDLNQSNLKIL